MNKGKLVVLAVIVALVAAFFVFDLKQYVSIEYFQAQRAVIEAYFQAHPVETGVIFFAVYVGVTGLSLPPHTDPSLFALCVQGQGHGRWLHHVRAGCRHAANENHAD